MKIAIRVFRLFVSRRRHFFVGLVSLAMIMAAAPSGKAEELPATVELEITRLAPPWGAPSHYLEGPCFVKIKNKGPHSLTIPVKGKTIFPVDLQEIVVRSGTTGEYLVILRRIDEFGPPVLFIHLGDPLI